MIKYLLLLLGGLLLGGHPASAQVRRGTGLLVHNHGEVLLHSYTTRLAIKPENRAQFILASRSIKALAQQETGCQSYHYYEDADTPNTFLLSGIWDNRAGIQAHMSQPYMVQYFGQLAHWLVEPATISFYETTKHQTTTLQAKP